MTRRREMKAMYPKTLVKTLSHDQGGLRYTSFTYSPEFLEQTKKVCYDEIHPNHPKDGGPFSLTSISNSWNHGFGQWGVEGPDNRGKVSNHLFTGGYLVYPTSSTLPTPDGTDLSTLGAAAYKKFSPLKPVVNGGQFLCEIRDMGVRSIMSQLQEFLKLGKNLGLNSLGRVRAHAPKNASNLYLAYQFGWKPFVQDVLSWLESVKKIDSQIARLRSNNGKWLRTGGVLFKTTSSSSSSTVGGLLGRDSAYVVPGTYTPRTTTIQKTKVWFKGTFRYYIPELDDPKWGKFTAARKLWGLELTPQLMWQIMPWSWLINWSVDVESLIHNLTSQTNDNLVSNGAWLMRLTETTNSSSVTETVKVINQIDSTTRRTYVISAACENVLTTKTRIAASPFGFGVSLPDLNSWRVSILSALGLSKLRFPNLKLP